MTSENKPMRHNEKTSKSNGASSTLFAAWPGVGRVGYMAAEFLVRVADAKPVAEIRPDDYIYPNGIMIEKNVIRDLIFPRSVFYKGSIQGKDLTIFIGEHQFPITKEIPAETNPAHRYALEMIDTARELGCSRIYTSGGIYSMIHHSMKSGLTWGANNVEMLNEMNERLRPEFSMRDKMHPKTTFIAGMNGIFPSAAGEKGVPAATMLGEVPIYMQPLNAPYPKASKSVLEAFAIMNGLSLPVELLDDAIEKSTREIDDLMRRFKTSLPPKERKDVFAGIDQLAETKAGGKKDEKKPHGEQKGGRGRRNRLTEEDARNAIIEIEQFFKKEQDK